MGGAAARRSRDREDGLSLAIVLGIVLDGIPESAVIGLGLLEGTGVSVAVIAAVFLSNLPEAIAATTGLVSGGWKRGKILGLWVGVTLVCGLASLLGYAIFDSAAWARSRSCSRSPAARFPDHAGRHDDARRIRARRQARRALTTLGFGLAFALTIIE